MGVVPKINSIIRDKQQVSDNNDFADNNGNILETNRQSPEFSFFINKMIKRDYSIQQPSWMA